MSFVIRQECGQTLARVRVSQTDIVSIIISLQWMESMWPGSHVIESRVVWKDLGSRRIGKSLEEVRFRDDVKKLWFLIVYTWCVHVQWRLKVWHQGTYRKHVRLYNYLERVDYLKDILPNNPTTLELPFFLQLINSFFLNQQFITWGAVADCGSYNITTYIRTKEKKREREGKGQRKRKRKGENTPS